MDIKKVSSDHDYNICLEIRKKVFVDEQEVPIELEVDSLVGENFLIYVEKEPAGTGRYQLKDGMVKFERIAILKGFRGHGLGRILMQAMQRHAEDQFPGLFQTMHAQVSAILFYERLGWVAFGDVFLDAGIEHRWMINQTLPRKVNQFDLDKLPKAAKSCTSFSVLVDNLPYITQHNIYYQTL